MGYRACLDGLDKEKYLYVPIVEPRIIQLLSVIVSFCGYFNAALANVFGENSDRGRVVLVRACVLQYRWLWCGLVRVRR